MNSVITGITNAGGSTIALKECANNKVKRRYVKVFTMLILTQFLVHISSYSQIGDTTITVAEIKTIHSDVLGEDRKIYIKTPARMKPGEQYPVLYLLDAEVQMTMVAGQVSYLSDYYKFIPSMIVVGVVNSDRMRDLTPPEINSSVAQSDTSGRDKPTGGGERFVQFMKQELMPYIETKYSTAPYKILAGHSLGGLISVYCLSQHPEMFNAYIAISPSLQWGGGFMLRQFGDSLNTSVTKNKRLFFSDANEGTAFQQNLVALDSILKLKKTGLSYKYVSYPEESHNAEPVKAFYDGVRYIYPNWHLPYYSSGFKNTVTSKAVREHYDSLSLQYGYKVVPLQDELNQVIKYLRNDAKRIKDAIELLKMLITYYPATSKALEQLGDFYTTTGDLKSALVSYKKAIALDLQNQALIDKVNSIEK
jgi:predicted alpha/beta superfamily hydrolase